MSGTSRVGRVVSVNVGAPRPVEYRGRTIKTGIWKNPVEGAIHAGEFNLDGDGQADLRFHGGQHKAVYAYPVEHYTYWESVIDRQAMPFGQFGENLTTAGLEESGVRIGDRLRIGNAVLQVSEPRVPCYKLAMRMGAGDDFSQKFLHSGRVGFYLRVLTPGHLAAGDPIERIQCDIDAPSIEEFVRVTLSGKRTIDELRSVAMAPDLSEGWRATIRTMISTELRRDQPAWRNFKDFKVVETIDEAPGIRSIFLAPDDQSALPSWLPGQHVTVKRAVDGLTRCYSISGQSLTAGALRITVKQITGPDHAKGEMSSWLHSRVKGDPILLGAPRGNFHIDPVSRRPAVLLAGGVGITPLMPILEHCVSMGVPVQLLHYVRSPLMRIYSDILSSLAEKSVGLSVAWVYSSEAVRDELSLGNLVDPEMIEWADFYVCGPAPLMDSLTRRLLSLGVTSDRILSESFVGAKKSGILSADAMSDGAKVTFARSEIELEWTGDHYSLLDFAEENGVKVTFGCRAGSCGQCQTGLKSGSVSYVEPVDEPDNGDVLLCCCIPNEDIELDL